MLVLSEQGRLYGGGRTPLDIWADWAVLVEGEGLPGGHLLPETAADQMIERLLAFLGKITDAR